MTLLEFWALVVTAAGAGGAMALALATWLGGAWAQRFAKLQDRMDDIDIDLRNKRIKHYQKLWSITGVLPEWPRNPNFTYAKLDTLSRTLKDWYFAGGGLYLSTPSRKIGYENLQTGITAKLKLKKTGKISDEDYTEIRDLCSELRTFLTADIQSRREGISETKDVRLVASGVKQWLARDGTKP